MATATQDPIFKPIGGLCQIGGHGKINEFDRVGVYPPDRNGMMQIATAGIQTNGKPIFLTMTRDSAIAIANLILSRCGLFDDHVPV